MSIDKDEHDSLVSYFKTFNIKMKTVDVDGNKADLRSSPAKTNEAMDYDDEEDAEDESFDAENNSMQSDEEESEARGGSSDDDVDMVDEELDKDEIKALRKEAGNVDI